MDCATSPVTGATATRHRKSPLMEGTMATLFMIAAAVISLVFLIDFARTIRDLQRDRQGSERLDGFNV